MLNSLPYFYQPDQAITPPFPLAWAAFAVVIAQEPNSSARDWLRNQNRLRRLQARSFPPVTEVQFDSSFLYEWRATARGSSLPPIVAYMMNRDTDRRAYRARRAFAQEMHQVSQSLQIDPQYDVYRVFADKVSEFPDYGDMAAGVKRWLAMLEIEGHVFALGAQTVARRIADVIVRMEVENA